MILQKKSQCIKFYFSYCISLCFICIFVVRKKAVTSQKFLYFELIPMERLHDIYVSNKKAQRNHAIHRKSYGGLSGRFSRLTNVVGDAREDLRKAVDAL